MLLQYNGNGRVFEKMILLLLFFLPLLAAMYLYLNYYTRR